MNIEKRVTIIFKLNDNLDRTIKSFLSILEQSYSNLEIICLENRYTNRSIVDHIREYASLNNNITIVYYEDSDNVIKNLAISRASGEYIILHNGYDIYKNLYIENLFKIKDNPNNIADTVILKNDNKKNVELKKELPLSKKIKNRKLVFKFIGNRENIIFNHILSVALIRKYNIEFYDILDTDSNFMMKYIAIADNISFYHEKIDNKIINIDNDIQSDIYNYLYSAGDIYNFYINLDLYTKYKDVFNEYYNSCYKLSKEKTSNKKMREKIKKYHKKLKSQIS